MSDQDYGDLSGGITISEYEAEKRRGEYESLRDAEPSKPCKSLSMCVTCRTYVDAQFYAGAYWAFSPGSTDLHRCKP